MFVSSRWSAECGKMTLRDRRRIECTGWHKRAVEKTWCYSRECLLASPDKRCSTYKYGGNCCYASRYVFITGLQTPWPEKTSKDQNRVSNFGAIKIADLNVANWRIYLADRYHLYCAKEESCVLTDTSAEKVEKDVDLVMPASIF